jgi:hypothetical protein
MAAAKVAAAATGVQIDRIDVEAGAEGMDKYGAPRHGGHRCESLSRPCAYRRVASCS